MQRMRTRGIVILIVLLASSLSLTADASDPTTTVGGVIWLDDVSALPPGHFAPYDKGTTSPQVVSPPITAGTCTYRQANDDPHMSGTGFAASIHGWWLIEPGTGACPGTATVTTYLQAWYCSGNCYWVTLTATAGSVQPGPGAGKRTTARWNCANGNSVGWRGFVDVDLDNWSDPPGFTYSNIRNLPCSPT